MRKVLTSIKTTAYVRETTDTLCWIAPQHDSLMLCINTPMHGIKTLVYDLAGHTLGFDPMHRASCCGLLANTQVSSGQSSSGIGH
jgi:hypothetical protein